MQLLSNSSKLSLSIHNGRHLVVSARVEINRVYIRGHLVSDDYGGVIGRRFSEYISDFIRILTLTLKPCDIW